MGPSVSIYYVGYDLQNGYIHNWLVAGPQAIPVQTVIASRSPEQSEGAAKQSPSRKDEIASSQKPVLSEAEGTLLAMTRAEQLQLQIAHHYFEEDSGVTQLPVQGETLAVGDAELTWNYVRCLDDHFVDLSAFYPTCHYLRAWAYARVVSPASQEVTFILTANGPADLWLNGQHIHRQEVTTQAVIASEAKQSPSRKEEIASSQKTLLAMTRAEQLPLFPGIYLMLPAIVRYTHLLSCPQASSLLRHSRAKLQITGWAGPRLRPEAQPEGTPVSSNSSARWQLTK
jgi:hypothetical protein